MYFPMVQQKTSTNIGICNNCGLHFKNHEGGFVRAFDTNAHLSFCSACQYQLYLELCDVFEEPKTQGQLLYKNNNGFITTKLGDY